jgi:hypothetical protein
MTLCKYYDCGWCYAPENVPTSAQPSGACLDSQNCPYLRESQMTEMYGGNTPIVPDETINQWKSDGKLIDFQLLCKELVDDLDAWMEYDGQPSRLQDEYQNSLELIYKVRRILKGCK